MSVLLRLSAGLIGWAIAFCAIYGLHGIGCANGWPARVIGGMELQTVALVAAWSVALAATLGIALLLSRRRTTALDRAAAATGWIGFAAVAVSFAPIVVVPSCL